MTNVLKTMSIMTMLCGLFGCGTQQKAEYTSLTADAYETAIADTGVVRLDVRTAEEYAEGHIHGTLNIDVLQQDFEDKALSALPKGKTIAVNCRSGKRSKSAAAILVRHGYKVIELDTGYNGWLEAGKPVEK